MSKLVMRLKAWRERSIKSRKPQQPPASLVSPSLTEAYPKSSFMDLPAEIRDEIYLYCFQENPEIHFSRPPPIESRMKKLLLTARSNKPPTWTKHGLLLVNRVVSEGYKNVADKLATPVFHMTTFWDDQDHMTGKAYWVTSQRMKERLTSCRIHIDLAQCRGLDLYHVQQDIKSDLASFIWEHERLRSVILNIKCSGMCAKGFVSGAKAFDTVKKSIVVPLLQHRPLEGLLIRNGTAAQLHTRVQDRNGWIVMEWPVTMRCEDDAFWENCTFRECWLVEKAQTVTWYCEDLHHLKEEASCNDNCEDHLQILKLGETRLDRPLDSPVPGWLLMGCTCDNQERM
ncbi:hypothetical protein BLS_003370 [Venturia inaequalis]|uniref:Uncharacterized protein n=1 Tax=Venturia inaequalis TaxID=5025 RepID=A0A8H3Z317_VENIN|nr:hypothetical protein BLS_003370 [Venturia inaequalis]KAE9992881.1 hypothetical protein EG327_007358 [Venturia inaequalis]RDI84920.1 hypothetical protein Vi05172_g4954 [Venturia inaequalis]